METGVRKIPVQTICNKVCHGASASVNIADADEIYESLHVRKLSNYGRLNSAVPAGPEAGSQAKPSPNRPSRVGPW